MNKSNKKVNKKVNKSKKNKYHRIPNNDVKDVDKTKTYNVKGKKNKKNPKLRKAIKITVLVILLIIIIIAGIVIGKLYSVFKEAKLDVKDVAIKYENSVVVDGAGTTIAILTGDENRKPVRISEMSEYLPKAFVAIEDERFYEHSGVDVKRTGAATLTYILNGGKSGFGGSTITQQMIKNITTEDDRTWQRKVREMARAYYIEKEMSKTQILELYLNLIFLGGQTYGVEVASQFYFSKSASELTLAQSAFLAGINKAPNAYSPFSEDEEEINAVKNRTKVVLDKMHQLGPNHKAGITDEEYNNAITELENGLGFNRGTITQNVYSYHTEAAINQVKRDLKEKHGYTDDFVDAYVKSGGLTIYTTQNTEMQNIMQAEVEKDKYIEYSRKMKDETGNALTVQTAMVLMDHKTGNVLATVGAIGAKTTSFGLNRATQSVRQTGSSIKPLAVVCPGIDAGIITAASVFDDIPYSSGPYGGFKDYGNSYTGLTTLRHNVAQSKNIPMLKAMNQIGVERSSQFLESIGISVNDGHKDITLALGSQEVSPLNMAAAYATIANDGVYIEPTFYTKVVNSNGEVVLEAEQETRTAMSASTAYIVKEILTEVVRSGAGGYAAISGISVGVKTGTTSDDFDRWFCGFTPYYTAATWYGYDYNETVRNTSSNPAGKIWDGVMEQIHNGLPAAKFSDTKPSNVITATICRSSGKLATELCKNDPRGNQVYTEFFVKGTAPTETCDCHVEAKICLDTGLLANEYCKNVETKVYITRPATETGNWKYAADAKYMLTVKDICTQHVKPVEPIKPVEPEKPDDDDDDDEGNTTGGNTTGGNTTGGNTTGNTTDSNVVNRN